MNNLQTRIESFNISEEDSRMYVSVVKSKNVNSHGDE